MSETPKTAEIAEEILRKFNFERSHKARLKILEQALTSYGNRRAKEERERCLEIVRSVDIESAEALATWWIRTRLERGLDKIPTHLPHIYDTPEASEKYIARFFSECDNKERADWFAEASLVRNIISTKISEAKELREGRP